MIGYTRIEAAVKSRIVNRFGVDETLCQQGDIDVLFTALQSAGAPLGFLLEYAGGTRLKDAPFNGRMWGWHMNGYALVRFEGDTEKIEDDARVIVDRLTGLFEQAHTLDGLVAVTFISEIDMPIPSNINDVPFYWIPFTVEVMEKI